MRLRVERQRGRGDKLRHEFRKLRRAAVIPRLHVHAISHDEDLKAAQDQQVNDDAEGAVKKNIDEVPARDESDPGLKHHDCVKTRVKTG